ncbi:hypothetical protein ENSA5_14960 [Enhygromyxa salina]|uniref:Uncharacterized protein n=1 Tax=Enhygromyxa salina TaxID=215803 RepID=A0A2S9YEN6_9BACT|nr:hypothetical protein [Enhygromyxa salina]PRQ03466.1 hypothetical protein ENSA5_14960 [Enhygromyxa salina]
MLTADAEGDYEFAVIDADFTPVLSLIDYVCSPTDELSCSLPLETLTQPLLAVDSDDGQAEGTATLTITPL